MKAENEERNRFESIIELCQPTASQEAKFLNCPLSRESENFADSNPDQFSSSPDLTPSEQTGIVMVSPPGSSGSLHQHADDEAVVFHTPPEHHYLSSSEEQSLNEFGAEGLDGLDRTKKVRGFEPESDDKPKTKRIRVDGVEFGGGTVLVGETKAIGGKGDGDGDDDTEVILESAHSGDEMSTVNLGEDSVEITSKGDGIEAGTSDVVRKVGVSTKDCASNVDVVKGNRELGKKCMYVEGTGVSNGEKPNENSDLSGSLDSGRIEEEIVKLEYIAGNRCIKARQNGGVGGSKQVVKIMKDAKMPEDGHRNGDMDTNGKGIEEKVVEIMKDAKMPEDGCWKGGLEINGKRVEEIGEKNNGKRIEEIDDFRYVGDVDRRWKGKTCRAVGGSDSRRQLPVSLEGKEKDVGAVGVVETAETNSGLLDFLDVLKAVVGDTDGDSEDVDFLGTARRRGLTFSRARWWPSEGDDYRITP